MIISKNTQMKNKIFKLKVKFPQLRIYKQKLINK
jgi:hypothetical protein